MKTQEKSFQVTRSENYVKILANSEEKGKHFFERRKKTVHQSLSDPGVWAGFEGPFELDGRFSPSVLLMTAIIKSFS